MVCAGIAAASIECYMLCCCTLLLLYGVWSVVAWCRRRLPVRVPDQTGVPAAAACARSTDGPRRRRSATGTSTSGGRQVVNL